MSIPINPGSMSGGAAHGRRDPRLVRELGQAGAAPPPPAATAPVAPPPPPPNGAGLPAGLVATPEGAVMPEDGYPVEADQGVYVYPGDVTRGRLTLAVDFGTGGTSFLYWEHGTIARDGETGDDIYNRVAGEILDKVERLADDVDDMLEQREARRTAAAQQAGV